MEDVLEQDSEENIWTWQTKWRGGWRRRFTKYY